VLGFGIVVADCLTVSRAWEYDHAGAGAGTPEGSRTEWSSAMDGRFQPTSPARVIGLEEMQALTLSVLGALERAGLTDMIAELKRRVLERKPEDVSDSVEAGNAVFHLTYKPIVELLLYEVRDVSRMPHLSAEHRRERITWAMSMAGL
jgi:hypothetical protein